MTDRREPFSGQGQDYGGLESLLRRAGDLDSTPGTQVWVDIQHDLDQDAAPPAVDDGRRRRSLGGAGWPLLAAAAVGALLTWVGSTLVSDADSGGDVVASATLATLPDAGEQAQGEVEVITRDGRNSLRVQLNELPDAQGGYLEVWLLRPDVSGMVTLGVLTSDEGEFDLPSGVDLTDYPVVDISLEEVDGDPTHGGQSVIRGQLEGDSSGHDSVLDLK